MKTKPISQTGAEVLQRVTVRMASLLVGLLSLDSHAATSANGSFVKGRVLVAPNSGLPEDEFNQIIRGKGVRAISRVGALNVHILEVPEKAEQAVAQALSRNPHIKFAEVDTIWEPDQIIPNDSTYALAWHLPKINAPIAWTWATGNGSTVAVLDTGVDGSHPDLSGQLVPGWNTCSNNADTSDIYGHGTQVAGSVGALTNNSVGVASVAWNAKLMPIRISNDASGGTATASAIASGLTWAADHGARIANISFPVAGSTTVSSGAQYFRNGGGVVIVAAGNTGTDPGFADTQNMVAVSATTSADQKASWSSYGRFVDVSAPGENIWTTTRGGGYAAVSGTSFASPVTAGVVALIRAANPSLTPTELETVLEGTAVDPVSGSDWHSYFGWGRIDAAAAVQLAMNTAAGDTQPPSAVIFSPTTGNTVYGTTTVNVDASDNLKVARVELYAGNILIGEDTMAPYTFSWATGGTADGNVTLTARAYDDAQNQGNSAGVTVAVVNQGTGTGTGADTAPPTVSFSQPGSGSSVSGRVTVVASAQDDQQVASMKLYIDGKLVSAVNGNRLDYNWNTKPVGKGIHTLQVIAIDGAGNQGVAFIQVAKK